MSLWHLLLRLVIAVIDRCASVVQTFTGALCSLWPGSAGSASTAKDASSKRGALPHHMCIAVLESDPSVYGVAQCVGWAAGLGVPWVTVWDPAGVLKSNASRLEQLVRSACAQEGVTAVDFRAGADISSSGGGGGSGAAESPQGIHGGVTVTVFDASDGRSDIARAARNVAAARQQGKLSEAELDALTPDGFGGFLAARVPQIDLVFKFGPVDSLGGMLPWHISVAEIIKFDSVRDVRERDFMDGIGTFVGSDRRFGR